MLKQQAISRSISSRLGLLRNEAGAVGWIELAVVTVGLLGAGVIYFTSVAPKMAVFDREASAAMAYQAAQAVSAKVALVDGTGNLRVADPDTVKRELNKVAKLLRSNADQDDFCAAAYRLSNCSASGCITEQVDSAVSDVNPEDPEDPEDLAAVPNCSDAPPTTPEVQMALNARGNQAGQADRYAVLAYSPSLTDRSGRPSFAVYGASFRAISSAAPGGGSSDNGGGGGNCNPDSGGGLNCIPNGGDGGNSNGNGGGSDGATYGGSDNGSSNQSEDPPACQAGFEPDGNGGCQAIEVEVVCGEGQELVDGSCQDLPQDPQCPDGQIYDEASQSCIPDSSDCTPGGGGGGGGMSLGCQQGGNGGFIPGG